MIRLGSKTQIDRLDLADATRLDYNETYTLLYSKSTDNLPITQTSVETRPCTDPDLSSDFSLYG